MTRWSDPASWDVRWWLPLAGVVAAAGLWLERPEAGPPPRVDVVAEAPPSCGELADGLARAACNAR